MTKESVRRDVAIREAWRTMAELVLNNERRREVLEKTGLNFGKMRALRRVAARPMPMRELAEHARGGSAEPDADRRRPGDA